MLEELRISGLGVIDEAILDLDPGLTVLTGETGAGKTMVVQGLGLLLGGRADAGQVRPGATRTLVEGRLLIDAANPALGRAMDAGADLDAGVLLVSRAVAAEGRSRCYLGGHAVPIGVLTEVLEPLVAVHGQSDQLRLLRPAEQRAALDRYAGEPVTGLLERWRSAYGRLVEVARARSALTGLAQQRARETQLLEYGLAEITAAAPRADETAQLAAEVDRLAHADALRAAAETARVALTGDPEDDRTADAGGLVARARQALDPVSGHDPVLAGLAGRLADVGYLLADIGADLASYCAEVEVDPARLAAAQERQASLGALIRRYGEDLAAVLAWAANAEQRLTELTGDDDRLTALAAEEAQLRVALAGLAGDLTAGRTEAARGFARAVGAELAVLALASARVGVAVSQRDDPTGLLVGSRRIAFGPTGADDIELTLAAHPGAPSRPLARGASGGELARVMLAVEVVLAGGAPAATLVFDEVDAGVGGRAAIEVGRRLALLARRQQVLVVTHLPQIAAFAGTHFQVEKSDDGRVTAAGVRRLDHHGRVRELSRMLAGLADSATARAHAEELLALASVDTGGS